jgi:uncharacterized membrane protein YhaH (DUF805 family)
MRNKTGYWVFWGVLTIVFMVIGAAYIASASSIVGYGAVVVGLFCALYSGRLRMRRQNLKN